PPPSKFTGYTPLNAPRERILAEVSSADFKKAGIQFPKQFPTKPNMDRSKYCCYHRSYRHVTEDCIHLKDAIEILIQKGYARKYVKDGEKETHETQMAIEVPTPEEDDNHTALPT
ncbi:hypothetical protein A2U01_0063956, partial [Trifolium medium]|nr:hypothetical protein [Trifolium medium]